MNHMSVRLSTIWIALFAISGRASASTARWSTRAMPDASIFCAGKAPATLIVMLRVFMAGCGAGHSRTRRLPQQVWLEHLIGPWQLEKRKVRPRAPAKRPPPNGHAADWLLEKVHAVWMQPTSQLLWIARRLPTLRRSCGKRAERRSARIATLSVAGR